MQIRQAEVVDYDSVMQLYNGLVGEDRYSRHGSDSFMTILESPSHGIFVADDDSLIIGVASVSIRRVVRYVKPIAELDELFVKPDTRSHGVGKALMHAVEEFARGRDCYRLYIESGYQHEEGHGFYEHLGYKNNGYHFLKNL